MIATTTDHVEGQVITRYLGLVSGEVVSGINALRDLGAGMRNIFGGRSAGYEDEVIQARESAIGEMVERAQQVGANAIVGVRIDYTGLSNGTMIMVNVTGTAVQTMPASAQ
ncbi:hypothetical protein BSR29_07255 [Boudabousia liubingyangii]|uniref:UPF0145 protein BSR29_07255 n=1 Tax=Boudabousia liubingyangii TaxID=1921764 RepID=A0A1Q5PKB4_9ACTO|nr:YbjQ family protein [Boudabousia liubingyangii]OKL46611.1 hypothetical protein BSR29_07255 [Boudabousia liubingyangii]OKL46800.1 hypothetical protein BSR28_05010 [Boudabousia liubingyangii]